VLVLTNLTGLTTLNKNWPLFVYPTITHDKVYLLSNWTSDVTINLELLNTTGQLLYTKKINAHSGLQEILSIQALGLSKGVYFIRLNSNDNENDFQKTIKIITN